MTDPNMTEFYGRVARLQKGACERLWVRGARELWAARFTTRGRTAKTAVGPGTCCLFLMCLRDLPAQRCTIYHSVVGAQSYNDRVAALMASDGIERIGGWLMQEEAATRFVADAKSPLVLAKTMST